MAEELLTDNSLPLLQFTSHRRYGIELEINSFDGKSRPEGSNKPAGINQVLMLVRRNTTDGAEIRNYEHTDNNDGWVIKPDSSCGMEICTPIYKGWDGLKRCCKVVNAMGKDPMIKVDTRCSVHVHVEVANLTKEQLGSVIAHWFKVEPVFMDSVPPHRKRNRYCQAMGFVNLVDTAVKITPQDLINRVGNVKYYSLNTNQMVKNGRKSIEFRIIEGDGCKTRT